MVSSVVTEVMLSGKTAEASLFSHCQELLENHKVSRLGRRHLGCFIKPAEVPYPRAISYFISYSMEWE